MKKTGLFLMVLFFTSAAIAETVTVSVNGMICSFCAFSIEKLFSKREEVKNVKVDLDNRRVEIGMRPGKTLDDATVGRLIADSGYDMTGIARAK